MPVKKSALFGSRSRSKARSRSLNRLQDALQEIPEWVFELAILAVVMLVIRHWLGRRDRKIAAISRVLEAPLVLRETAEPAEAELPPDSQVSPGAPSSPSEADDLKRIEGIGPKVAGLLIEAGIATFSQLAQSDEEDLRRILKQAGLAMMNPSSWPEQARLAYAGDWDGLKALQSDLKGGRRVTA